MLKIKTIANTLSEEDIKGLLENRDKSINIEKVDKLYYPYVKMIYSIQMKNSLSKLNRLIMCNIDMVHGRPAIGQGKPDFTELEIDDFMAIDPMIKEENLDQIGHDYVIKIFLSKMKILHTPQIAVESLEWFHKLFYIVQCKDSANQDYFIMADSMDGNFSILDC